MATLSGTRSSWMPARVEQTLESLSPRDRILLVGLMLFAAAALTGGFWYLLHSTLEEKASRVRSAKETYARVEALEVDYRDADSRFAAQKDRLDQITRQPVTAWIEELANKHQLGGSLSSVAQKGSEQVGDITQTKYNIELKRAKQDILYRFLHELETSGYPARVDNAAFKVVTVKKEKAMDLSLEITVLSMATATEGETP
ncbi:MAG: type II secretion system protein GspM [Myxococcota bacterium]